MIDTLHTLITTDTNPYGNLALEEELLNIVEANECILYLWQNRDTVVLGRNQNCRAECRVEELEADGGFVARRLSGGGAVFHDLGNLNFTFLVRKENYDLDRQLGVILEAVRLLGLRAERTGRNDVTVDGRKFSGNAFYSSGGRCYHHGTILIAADTARMSRYLTVDPGKLNANGVKSVRSRVVNLRELVPDLTVPRMQRALTEAFGKVYGGTPMPLPPQRPDSARLARGTQKFASWEWRIGTERPFTTMAKERFGWGGVELRLLVERGKIHEATVFTDALDDRLAQALKAALTGADFSKTGLTEALAASDTPAEARRDVAEMLNNLV